MTSYRKLLNKIKDFCRKLRFPHEVQMWVYPKKRLRENWNISDLNERVAAARQLGYEVLLRSTDEGLEVWYRKEMPMIPYEWKREK